MSNINNKKITVATAWLDGCSGCHMSILDLDQKLIDLIEFIEIVYSPLIDVKILPLQVDLGILEGSLSTEEDLIKARLFRKNCNCLISLGDCAVNGNVPSLRNHFQLSSIFKQAFHETATIQPQIPTFKLPKLREPVKPIHGEVPIDIFIPGCPPSADTIWYVLNELIAGRMPDPSTITRFGA